MNQENVDNKPNKDTKDNVENKEEGKDTKEGGDIATEDGKVSGLLYLGLFFVFYITNKYEYVVNQKNL